jgi:hypothetical protein
MLGEFWEHLPAGLSRFFLVQHTQNTPNGHKIYQRALKYTYGSQTDKLSLKFTSIFHCKTLQNLPKLAVFGLKIGRLATLTFGPFFPKTFPVTLCGADDVNCISRDPHDIHKAYLQIQTLRIVTIVEHLKYHMYIVCIIYRLCQQIQISKTVTKVENVNLRTILQCS